MTGRCPSLHWMLLLAVFSTANAQAAEHTPEVSARLRWADVEVGSEPGRAASILVRGRLASRWSEHWSSLLEVDHVSSAWRDEHSDGRRLNGKPLVSDVPGTELNQLALRYRGIETEVTLGRQRIEWDDQRFVGSDSFWQQDQTFDALYAERRLLVSSRFHYAYISRAHRIYAGAEGEPEDWVSLYEPETEFYAGYRDTGYSLAGEHEHNSHLARLELNEWDYTQLVFYGHAIDNQDQPETSNYTLGARYRFAYRAHPLRYRLVLELASQENRRIEGQPQPQYYLAELALGYQAFEWIGRYEVLGSDDGVGFVTPLGSPYLFQGFAGVFPVTPEQGLEDVSTRINWRSHPWELSARFHHFSRQSGSGDYGRELDLELQYKAARRHELALRYADFRAHPENYYGLWDERRVYLDYRYNF